MTFPGDKLKSGWGVVRDEPWHLAGVYRTSAEAEVQLAAMGSSYKIRYGETARGSDAFIWQVAPFA